MRPRRLGSDRSNNRGRVARLPRNLSLDVKRVIALCWCGYTDFDEIAKLVGITSARAYGICESEDPLIARILKICPEDMPVDFDTPILCKGCDRLITNWPCIPCKIKRDEKKRANGSLFGRDSLLNRLGVSTN